MFIYSSNVHSTSPRCIHKAVEEKSYIRERYNIVDISSQFFVLITSYGHLHPVAGNNLVILARVHVHSRAHPSSEIISVAISEGEFYMITAHEHCL